LEKQGKKWKKKADLYKNKIAEMEAEKARLESKLRQRKIILRSFLTCLKKPFFACLHICFHSYSVYKYLMVPYLQYLLSD
jgi:hypothetical protein